MEDDRLKIFIRRLREGEVEQIAETLPPEFMEVNEEELLFADPIDVKGSACIAGEMFVLRLNLKTNARLPCVVCNALTPISLEVNNMVHSQEMSTLTSGIFRMGTVIREALLLELPLTTECGGECPERCNLVKYFKGE